MILELSEKETRLLLRLLKEHLYFGWIEQQGEFDLVSSGEISPTLRELYRRLRQGQAKAA